MNELVVATTTAVGAATNLGDLLAAAADAAARSYAANTRRGYAGDLARFAAWCADHGLCALPADPAAVAAYVTALVQAGKKWGTVARALAAISTAHKERGLVSPTADPRVAKVCKTYRRELTVAPTKKAPVTVDMLRAASEALADDLRGRRDRALLLLGFAGAFRRSELVGLRVEDVEVRREGLVVTVRRSKRDQDGRGITKPVAYGSTLATCPVRAVQAWLEAAAVTTGPLFRDVRGGVVGADALCDVTVARVVKAAARAAGVDAAAFAGHSLRSGVLTAGAQAGKRLEDLAELAGHSNLATTRGYIQRATVFDRCANAGIGL